MARGAAGSAMVVVTERDPRATTVTVLPCPSAVYAVTASGETATPTGNQPTLTRPVTRPVAVSTMDNVSLAAFATTRLLPAGAPPVGNARGATPYGVLSCSASRPIPATTTDSPPWWARRSAAPVFAT